MKLHLLLATLVLTSCAHQKSWQPERVPASDAVTSAMFSPWEGTQAFDKMYKAIASGKQDVKVTVYSWSDSGFDKALEDAVVNGADVKVVLHPDLAKDEKTKTRVAKLEGIKSKGRAAFKIAPRNMHEKFVIVDGKFVVNSSANMSNGAKTKYSENFVFLTGPDFIIDNFENEFAVLWNSGKDVLTHSADVVEDRLPYDASKHQTTGKEVTLYSSSMNFDYVENAASSVAFQEGKFIKLVTKSGQKPYTVRDAIIKAINNAKKSIHGSFNHFNMLEISQALVEASKRGVDVKLTVDNQEFRERWNPEGIEMTPHFVENWKKLPGNANKVTPVRVKFYSHSPNPAMWFLNHHKFFLVDNGSSDAVLFTGSHNLSETAEHNQFDNMVSFAGPKYAKLQKEFMDEFSTLWSLERAAGDKPSADGLSYFTTVNNGSLPIHTQKPVSFTWEEIIKLRSDIRAIAPDFLRQMNRKAGSCKGYDVVKKQLWGCQ
jgi:phosphatidylserine/phosphatidylglycerophosphate/cardiolipin synthase-like enzyme